MTTTEPAPPREPTLLDALRAYAAEQRGDEPPSTANASNPFARPAPLLVGGEPYALAALSDEAAQVAMTREGGRNDRLNIAGLKIGQLVAGGALDAQLAYDTLTDAARAAGLTETEITATLESAGRKAAEQPRGVPERDLPMLVAPIAAGDNAEPDDPNADPAVIMRRMFDNAVALEVHKMRVRDTAREALERERRDASPPLNPLGLPLFLAVPDDDATYRINDVWPTGGRVLLAAQHKAGKTTLVGNLIRSLADGAPFLERFGVTATARIALIDTELDERMLRRWMRSQEIVNADNVSVLPMRGRLSSFDILTPDVRTQWANVLRGHDVIVLDCLRPALDALGLDEAREAGRFLEAFDELLLEAGVREAIVVHHMGHSGERSRGDSRILDWPDALWKIVRQTSGDGGIDDEYDEANAPRFFMAYGRDVDVPEDELFYDVPTRRLRSSGRGSRGNARKLRKQAEIRAEILNVLESNGPMSGGQIEREVTGGAAAVRTVRSLLVAQAVIVEEPRTGRGGGMTYRIP